jgi:hypothetical protein
VPPSDMPLLEEWLLVGDEQLLEPLLELLVAQLLLRRQLWGCYYVEEISLLVEQLLVGEEQAW